MNNSANNTVIDIAATFQALYGYLPAQIPNLPNQTSNINPYNVNAMATTKTKTAAGSNLYGLSDMIGREVFLPITLWVSKTEQYDFPFSIISIRNKKILKETPMTERGGVVVEEIALGAWEVTLKGFLIDAKNQFPDDQLTQLYNLYTNKHPVQLHCALSDLFFNGMYNVVIKNIDIPAKAKVVGVRDFSFDMIQDSILDLFKVD